MQITLVNFIINNYAKIHRPTTRKIQHRSLTWIHCLHWQVSPDQPQDHKDTSIVCCTNHHPKTVSTYQTVIT